MTEKKAKLSRRNFLLAVGAGGAASAAIVTSFSAMLWYNSLATPLAFMVLAYALLWRNEQAANRQGGQALESR